MVSEQVGFLSFISIYDILGFLSSLIFPFELCTVLKYVYINNQMFPSQSSCYTPFCLVS
jgi:hypothetical protein